MTNFGQMGDPVCPDCLCEHHEEAYVELAASAGYIYPDTLADGIGSGGTVVSQTITTTERCCVITNAAIVVYIGESANIFQIERPVGVTKTSQRSWIGVANIELHHIAAWEVLDPGTYTYYAVNRHAWAISTIAAWLKIIASDCEG